MMDQRLTTVDELWALSHRAENDDKRFRLIEGVLYEAPLVGWLSGSIMALLTLHVGRYVLAHLLGRMTAAETGYILHQGAGGQDTVLAPSLAFVRAERIPVVLPEFFVPFAPDLAVEVLSPSNADVEITAEVDAYLRYGTRMVWVVHPKGRRINVYCPTAEVNQASVRFLSVNDTLDGEDVLPGFTLPLRQLFEA